MMSAREKSDLPEVARKRANKAASAAAEPVERRGGAKENAELQSTVRTQSREAMKHVSYGVKPEHYAPVGVALLWTLERGLGTEWTPDLAAAWTAPAAFLADRRG